MEYIVEKAMLNNRIIRLTGTLTDEIADDIIDKMLYFANIEPHADIKLYINSGGGSVSAGLAIYDTIRTIPCDVQTYCRGIAASMGAFILSSGTKGKRYAFENSTIMLHEVSAGGSCQKMTTSDMIVEAKYSERLNNRMIQLIAHNTGKTFEHIKELIAHDYFMNAEEAIAQGVVDYIL